MILQHGIIHGTRLALEYLNAKGLLVNVTSVAGNHYSLRPDKLDVDLFCYNYQASIYIVLILTTRCTSIFACFYDLVFIT